MIERRKSGFTLLELLVVLALIALMSGLVVPRLSNSMVNLELKTASRKTAAALRYARSRAASEKVIYRAVFDLGKNQLWVLPGPRAVEAGEKPLVADESEDRVFHPKVYDLPEGIEVAKAADGEPGIEPGFVEILFFPNGSSSGGSVRLSNERGRHYTISVDHITGLVKLTLMLHTYTGKNRYARAIARHLRLCSPWPGSHLRSSMIRPWPRRFAATSDALLRVFPRHRYATLGLSARQA